MEDREMLQQILEKVGKISELLYGNGKVGLCEQVRDLEKEIKEVKSAPKKLYTWIMAAFNLVNIAVILYFMVKGKTG